MFCCTQSVTGSVSLLCSVQSEANVTAAALVNTRMIKALSPATLVAETTDLQEAAKEMQQRYEHCLAQGFNHSGVD